MPGLVHETGFSELIRELRSLPNLSIHPGVGKPDRPGLIDVQITEVGASKSHALAELRRINSVTIEQTLAIGDNSNDLPLFEQAGTRIAMGNAIPELKDQADYIVSSAEQDGWAETMERFVPY